MKKMTLATAALTALIAASTTTSVFAAGETSSAISYGHAQLLAGTKPTDPIDPEDPGTGNAGPLSLDVVPTFDFKSQELEGGDTLFENPQVLNADGSFVDRDGHIQVTDARGTGDGWSVSVNYVDTDDKTTAAPISADEAWKDQTDATLTLKGAQMSLPASTWSSSYTEQITDGAPSVTTAITLDNPINETPQTFVTASTDEGMGTWLGSFAQDGVKLNVPQGNKVGDYKANLLWTLTAAPEA